MRLLVETKSPRVLKELLDNMYDDVYDFKVLKELF